MAITTLEYNSKNKTARRVLDGLLVSGIFKVKNDAKKAEQTEIRQNIRQVKTMIEDIRENGSDKYQNMDDFLATLKK